MIIPKGGDGFELGEYPDDVQRQIAWKFTGQPYWVAQYSFGKELRQYDNIDWAEIPKDGLWRVELHCPNGQVAVLEDRTKLGWRIAHFGLASVGQGGHQSHARVILLNQGPRGACTLYVWDQEQECLAGPLKDDIHNMKYGAPVTKNLSWPVLGLKPD